MEKVIVFRCSYCGEDFDDEKSAETHEDGHTKFEKANQMLSDGKTLGEINNECHIWDVVPSYLLDVTKSNCFTIQSWENCIKPAYQIVKIHNNGDLCVSGKGGFTSFYGSYMGIDSERLADPHPKEELYIHPGSSTYNLELEKE